MSYTYYIPSVSIKERNYNDDVLKFIIKNKFDVKDYDLLVNMFDDSSKSIQQAILDKFAINIEYLINSKFNFNTSLYSKVLLNDNLSGLDRGRIRVFIKKYTDEYVYALNNMPPINLKSNGGNKSMEEEYARNIEKGRIDSVYMKEQAERKRMEDWNKARNNARNNAE